MKLKILNLWDKEKHDNSMDRAFFHNLKAIKSHSEVGDLHYSGVGWPDWNSRKPAWKNIQNIYSNTRLPDIIITYAFKVKENYPGLKDVPIPKCMRFNETTYEYFLYILLNRDIGLCIFHHQNDTFNWRDKGIRGIKFENIPHCAESSIFKDYGEDKTTDILISGNMRKDVYPFRTRLKYLVLKDLSKRYKIKVIPHPGYRSLRKNKPNTYFLRDYSREINKSKIAITCSSRYKYSLMKYIEIPMSRSLLAADIPDERHDFFRKFMLVLDPGWSDKQIIDRLSYYVEHNIQRAALVERGYALVNRTRTQEHYAKRFICIVKDYLRGTGKL